MTTTQRMRELGVARSNPARRKTGGQVFFDASWRTPATGGFYLQLTDTAKSDDEARRVLGFLRTQGNFVGGRILKPGPTGKEPYYSMQHPKAAPVWRVQAFFEDEPGVSDAALKTVGMRRVRVPQSMRRTWRTNPVQARRGKRQTVRTVQTIRTVRTMRNPSETPFREDLRANIAMTIARLKRQGTVPMSMANLLQVTPTPRVIEGAPRGTNAPYIYREMFRDLVNSTPAFRRFIISKNPANRRLPFVSIHRPGKQSKPTRRHRRTTRIFARRSGQRWTVRTARRGGLVIARRLSASQLRAWGRQHGYKLKAA